MSFHASSSLVLQLPASFADRQARDTAPAPVPMYTPMWFASKVLATTANDWWEDGVPPVRGRRQRATNAMAQAAAGVARRLHVGRAATPS